MRWERMEEGGAERRDGVGSSIFLGEMERRLVMVGAYSEAQCLSVLVVWRCGGVGGSVDGAAPCKTCWVGL